MRILQTIDNLYVENGGLSTCLYNLVKGLNATGCSADILSLSDDRHQLASNGEEWIKTLKDDHKTPFRISKNYKKFLLNDTDYDLYHTNGLWLYCNHITARTALKKRKPYIFSPHGMMYPQALKYSTWKKKLILSLFFNKDINRATCLHATCMQEAEYLRDLGYKQPVAVIPNGVIMENKIPGIKNQNISFRKIGFLGRLHPIKKIESLIEAFAKANSKNAELLIIGNGEKDYGQSLRRETERFQLKNVTFTGFLSGEEKQKALSTLSALFVPSESENFGMIVPEALMAEIPVMANTGTPWEDLNHYKCGWWAKNEVDSIATIMNEVFSMPEEELGTMGKNGRKLVEEKYAIDVVSLKMRQLYEWILNGGEKPEFVYD
ncbi:MAG: glycosyltransferase [Tannerella sp.]|jgi:glycosyltransferase involved in cell wall biosynthesis|nr:glycosyltransferase [Tannerella sp.]